MITLTPQAAEQIDKVAQHSNSEGMHLRVTARPGDAGAVIYGMGFDSRREGDLLVRSEGVSIVVMPEHVPLLDKAVLDFATLNTGHGRFVFLNPNDYGCFNSLGSCGACHVSCRPSRD